MRRDSLIIGSDEVIRAQVDAFASALRTLARQHKVAHNPRLTMAVKDAKIGNIHLAYLRGIEIGIPEDTLMSVRTLIFG